MTDDQQAAFDQARVRMGTHALIPTTPPRALLVSMAIRLHHDFNMPPQEVWVGLRQGFTPEEREAVLTSMAQLYEEVAGKGFYQWEQGADQRGGLYNL